MHVLFSILIIVVVLLGIAWRPLSVLFNNLNHSLSISYWKLFFMVVHCSNASSLESFPIDEIVSMCYIKPLHFSQNLCSNNLLVPTSGCYCCEAAKGGAVAGEWLLGLSLTTRVMEMVAPLRL